jgi:arabinofuranan 3-O-arabinosyltransferase
MELAPKTIENCVALCEAENIDAVVIPEVSVGEGFWANCTSLEKRCYLGANFIEGVRLVRSSTFRAIGMYDLDLEAGEDWDLVIRLEVAGFKKGRIKDFVLHNEGKLLLSETITKKYYYGRTIQNYVRKHPSFSKLQLSPWRFISTANRKELLKDPLHTAGMLYMKMCQFAALQIGRILTIKRKRFK